jgi:hypothetical protein
MDNPKLRMWITYAWADNTQGDFEYLVEELSSVGIAATYDKIAIVPGQRLWEQIAARITKDPIEGWGYLLTANSLASEACREELAYALDRTLSSKGNTFPLIGLLHGVRIEDVPPALRIRLCVSLASPTWKEEIKAGLEKRPPVFSAQQHSQYVWQVHNGYGGIPSQIAIEVKPRFGEIMYWRFVVPIATPILSWGHGPSDGGAIASIKFNVIEGCTGKIRGTPITWFGAGDRLSPGVSAYVVFNNGLPGFAGFGTASEPFGQPNQMEFFEFKKGAYTGST